LTASQREHQLLRRKWKELFTENQRLKQEIISLKEKLESVSPATTDKTNGIATESELVKTLAKKYTALYEPFSRIYNDPNLFVSLRPESNCLLPEKRFGTNLTARRDGWLAQLYDFLPENLHSMVRGHTNFDIEVRKSRLLLIFYLNVLQFRAAAKNMRSALIDRMRKAAPTIFQLNPDVFKPGYKRDTVPELVRLLKFSNENSKKDRLSKLPPILFPPIIRGKGRVGYETRLFQAPEIFLVSEQVIKKSFIDGTLSF
jgi:regulator of replication initiation timing